MGGYRATYPVPVSFRLVRLFLSLGNGPQYRLCFQVANIHGIPEGNLKKKYGGLVCMRPNGITRGGGGHAKLTEICFEIPVAVVLLLWC